MVKVKKQKEVPIPVGDDGTIKYALNELMYLLQTHALYPEQVDMVFEKEEFEMIKEEMDLEEDEEMLRINSDYGPIIIHRSK